MQLYKLGRARGLTFQLVGPQRLKIEGSSEVMKELDGAIDANANGLVAIVEELSDDSTVVSAAMALLRPPCASLAARRDVGSLQPHGHGAE